MPARSGRGRLAAGPPPGPRLPGDVRRLPPRGHAALQRVRAARSPRAPGLLPGSRSGCRPTCRSRSSSWSGARVRRRRPRRPPRPQVRGRAAAGARRSARRRRRAGGRPAIGGDAPGPRPGPRRPASGPRLRPGRAARPRGRRRRSASRRRPRCDATARRRPSSSSVAIAGPPTWRRPSSWTPRGRPAVAGSMGGPRRRRGHDRGDARRVRRGAAATPAPWRSRRSPSPGRRDAWRPRRAGRAGRPPTIGSLGGRSRRRGRPILDGPGCSRTPRPADRPARAHPGGLP